MSIQVRVERARCIGSGICLYTAPGVFALDAGGIAVVVDPTAAAKAEIVDAAERCPTRAIVVEEDGHRIA